MAFEFFSLCLTKMLGIVKTRVCDDNIGLDMQVLTPSMNKHKDSVADLNYNVATQLFHIWNDCAYKIAIYIVGTTMFQWHNNRYKMSHSTLQDYKK